MSRTLLQVDDEYGTATVILDHDLTADERALLEPLLDQLPDGVHPDHLLAVLTRHLADEQAYERVCQQRGLLL